MSIRIVLADDQALLRATFRLLLDSVEDFEVVGEASDGQSAIDVTRSTKPDVVIMDVRMDGMDGIEATHVICADRELIDVKVLVLTTFETEEFVVSALMAGASGFLGKDVEPVELIGAVKTVARGEQLLSPTATRLLISRVIERAGGPYDSGSVSLEDLTDREREIVAYVGRGLSNDEISAALFISPATVKTHVNRAMSKLGARDRAQLVVFAYQSGLAR